MHQKDTSRTAQSIRFQQCWRTDYRSNVQGRLQLSAPIFIFLQLYRLQDMCQLEILLPFQIGRLLPSEEYQERIVPCLVKLFESSDRNARYKLLCQMETFVEHLNTKVGILMKSYCILKLMSIKKYKYLRCIMC